MWQAEKRQVPVNVNEDTKSVNAGNGERQLSPSLREDMAHLGE